MHIILFWFFAFFSLSHALDSQQILWEIEALRESREIEYSQYLWLREWAREPEVYCLALQAEIPHLSCPDDEEPSTHRQRFQSSYTRGRYQFESSSLPQSHSWNWTQRLAWQDHEWTNRRTTLQTPLGQWGHYSGSSLVPKLYFRPISMEDFEDPLQVRTYFQGFNLEYAPWSSSLSWHQSDDWVQIHHFNHFYTHFQETQLRLSSQYSRLHTPLPESKSALIQQQHILHLSLTQQDLFFNWGQDYLQIGYHSQSKFWSSSSSYLNARRLPVSLSVPYTENTFHRDQDLQHFQWSHRLRLKNTGAQHSMSWVQSDTTTGFYKNSWWLQSSENWRWSYEHRGPQLHSLKDLQHRIQSRYRILEHSFHFPDYKLQQVWRWGQRKAPQRVYITWEPREPRVSYWRWIQVFPLGPQGRLHWHFQWRFYSWRQTDLYRFKVSYDLVF